MLGRHSNCKGKKEFGMVILLERYMFRTRDIDHTLSKTRTLIDHERYSRKQPPKHIIVTAPNIFTKANSLLVRYTLIIGSQELDKFPKDNIFELRPYKGV
jgi:hypothetical protein